MDFVTYLRKFENYKWYKPALEAIIVGIVDVLATILCTIIALVIVVGSGGDPTHIIDGVLNGYDGLDVYSLAGAILNLGSVACIIIGVAIATKIVRLRPFHTVASSCGGFNFKIFAKVMLVAIVTFGIPIAVDTLVDAGTRGSVEFTVLGFIACVILVPLQCCAEEFLFRGIILQAIGSWVKKPILAVVLQGLLFAIVHPYGIYGKIQSSGRHAALRTVQNRH